MSKISGLYGITIDNDKHLISHVLAALEGGARIIQYRNKSQDSQTELVMARKLAKLCRDFKSTFIINDNLDLALAVDADGVHLGKHDVSIEDAREKIGNKIIGVSCYNKLDLALEAQNRGADYVAFGRFFSSATKPDAVAASIGLIQEAKQKIRLPIVVIGGITIENAALLIQAGADAIAVINGLFAQEDIKGSAEKFEKLFK